MLYFSNHNQCNKYDYSGSCFVHHYQPQPFLDRTQIPIPQTQQVETPHCHCLRRFAVLCICFLLFEPLGNGGLRVKPSKTPDGLYKAQMCSLFPAIQQKRAPYCTHEDLLSLGASTSVWCLPKALQVIRIIKGAFIRSISQGSLFKYILTKWLPPLSEIF